MDKEQFLGLWIRQFLLDYLITVKNLSRNTQQSYRDTFRLFLPYTAEKLHKSIDKLIIEDISPDGIKEFLLNIELQRKCSITTRNQRLAAIHSFAQFVGLNSPQLLDWCRQIRLIPFKKAQRNLVTYLEKTEINALLNSPNQSTNQGKRDYAILIFLYNTGARADEIAQLTIEDLNIAFDKKKNFSTVLIKGKGNKLRLCPLWNDTVKVLTPLISGRKLNEHVFLNRRKEPITRFGIYSLVRRYVNYLLPELPSLKQKRVSPHTIRHTTATHLLHSGVDINTIRSWLGHV